MPNDQRNASLHGSYAVKGKTPKNLSASVRERLSQAAKRNGEEFQYVLTRYALERFLYRLSQSKHSDSFVLKGALLFQYWTKTAHRSTRDLDLLASGTPSIEHFEEVFREVCKTSVSDDGLDFLEGSIRGEQIKEGDEYQGIRIRGEAKLSNVKIPLQIDVGFGDAVTPGPTEIEYPAILDFPAPRLLAYNRETVVAEKFQAMVQLGMTNSRMKDFFDVYSLSRDFEFNSEELSAAIAATFKRRGTAYPEDAPLALSSEFYDEAAKKTQWNAFLRKGRIGSGTMELREVVTEIWNFLEPIVSSLRKGEPSRRRWSPEKKWADLP